MRTVLSLQIASDRQSFQNLAMGLAQASRAVYGASQKVGLLNYPQEVSLPV